VANSVYQRFHAICVAHRKHPERWGTLTHQERRALYLLYFRVPHLTQPQVAPHLGLPVGRPGTDRVRALVDGALAKLGAWPYINWVNYGVRGQPIDWGGADAPLPDDRRTA
jgi:hypothetical protein